MKIHNSSNLLLTEQCWVLEQRVTSTLSQSLDQQLQSRQITLVFQHRMMLRLFLFVVAKFLRTEPFVADGEEIQLNDKRYGVTVNYNSDTSNFTFGSGSTGELIEANGALGVTAQQKASSIEVGRYLLSTADGSVIDSTEHFGGDNHLMSVGNSKNDVILSQAEVWHHRQQFPLEMLQTKTLPVYLG